MSRGSKRLDAYRDGALQGGRRERVERRLERDPELAAQLQEREAQSRLIREAWVDGPPAPRADYLISALRPGMAQIDAEIETPSGLRRWLNGWLTPGPITALAGAAAAVLLLVAQPAWLPLPETATPSATTVAEAEPAAILSDAVAFGMPSAVYDLAQGETPLMLFEAEDGSTVIWLLEEEDDQLSLVLPSGEGWA